MGEKRRPILKKIATKISTSVMITGMDKEEDIDEAMDCLLHSMAVQSVDRETGYHRSLLEGGENDPVLKEMAEFCLNESKRGKEECCMDLKELKRRMRIANIMKSMEDEEDVHKRIDDLLLDYIDDAEVKELYDEVTKWYA